MATSSKIHLTPENGGVFNTPGLSWALARKVSEVLQRDMENNHVYLNTIEFYDIVHIQYLSSLPLTITIDHIVHFMLTIWALGASPETIQLQYERENKRQRPAFSPNETLTESLHDKKKFMNHRSI